MSYFLKCINNYTNFSGRARRKEYWMYMLFLWLFTMVAVLIDWVIAIAMGGYFYNIVSTLFSLATLLPSLAVGVRRLHDVDKSGWWMFISFVPVIGGIWLLILLATEGTPGKNIYGYNPKGKGCGVNWGDQQKDSGINDIAF